MRLSVVVATYNRLHLLLELLADLGRQTLCAADFEVIVIDDGSSVPAAPRLAELATPYTLVIREQPNAGQSAARHLGATVAQGEIIVFLDDDMRLDPDFLQQHLRAHEEGATVVQGYIATPPDEMHLPLFERFHAHQLERFVRDVGSGRARMRGIYVCTGNLSLRRADYFRVGGFDRTLTRSEDRELGVRLEKAGGKLALCPAARSVHHSDHDSLESWLARSRNYGIFDLRIARMHPDVDIADPWRFLFLVSPISKPLLLGALAAPDAGERFAQLVFRVAEAVDRAKGHRAAIAGATLAYGLEYFSGVRREYGRLGPALGGLAEYIAAKWGREWNRDRTEPAGASSCFVRAVREDYAALIRTRAKYNADIMPFYQLAPDVARKIGFQMMVAVRLMRLLRDGVHPLAAQIASRLIRHLYGAEIHWDTELEPGVVIIHGNGLVLSHGAHVGEGGILSHNVTLGEGTDAETRYVGAPRLGANVHIGPGATLIGPIAVGEGTKIMAGAVLAQSVAPNSLVQPAEAVVRQRHPPAAGQKPVRRLHDSEAAS